PLQTPPRSPPPLDHGRQTGYVTRLTTGTGRRRGSGRAGCFVRNGSQTSVSASNQAERALAAIWCDAVGLAGSVERGAVRRATVRHRLAWMDRSAFCWPVSILPYQHQTSLRPNILCRNPVRQTLCARTHWAE